MFKRESEQPVRISFEEKREKRKKRSIRERLSSIPVRRRIEAVALSVVTVMASLSIDWSSLSASAAEGYDTLQSGQKISTVFSPSQEQENTNTTLSKAKISVKIPNDTKEVEYTWKLYQNLTDESNPESGVMVAKSSEKKKIAFTNGGFVDAEINLSNVVLLGDETAAVVFTLTSEDGYDITYKTFNNDESRFVTDDGDWIEKGDGKCIEYMSATGGTPAEVTLSGVPEKLALTAGESYTFSDISWSPEYQRKLTLTNKNNSDLISQVNYPTFTVAESVGDGGTATVTVGGTGVNEKNVTVKVVSFTLKDGGTLTYTGSEFEDADVYTAKCGSEITPVTDYFTTNYAGTLVNGDSAEEPLNAGTYTMTITGRANTDYAGLSVTKDFKINQGTLTQEMFTGTSLASKSVATVKSGKIVSITNGTFSATRPLVYGVDFDAEITKTTPAANKVEYEITITGKNNFTSGGNAITLTAEESNGVSLEAVVDHIKFKNPTETYDAVAKTPEVEFYASSSEDSKITGVFEKDTNYTIKYNGVERSTGTVVSEADSIINAGEYTATVYGLETYAGSSMTTLKTEPYVLKPISFTTSNVTVTLKESSFEYSDSLAISPEVKDVTYKVSDTETRGLAAGTEYKMKSEEYSTQIGSHLVTVEGYGNYEGVATAEYTVFPSLLNSATVGLDGVTDGTLKAEKTAEWDYVWTYNRPYTYEGSAIEPTFTAKVNGESLAVGSGTGDMTKGVGVNNTEVTSETGKAYFILALPAKYASKKIKVEFEIAAKSLPSDALSFLNSSIEKKYAYGAAITLSNGIDYYVKDEGNTLIEKTHYTISYENNVNAGTATITATGIGNYTGSSSKTFKIKPISVNDVTITINPQKLNTSGTVVTNMDDVVITVIDKHGKEIHPFTSDDFTLTEYKNNLAAWITGEEEAKHPQVTLIGQRNLTGTKTVNFEILKETLTGLTWKLSGTSISGTLGSPGTTIDLTADYGYVVDFTPNLSSKTIKLYYSSGTKFDSINYTCKVNTVQAGTNTITISGKNNYDGGEYKFTYEVRKLNISSADCVFTQTDGDADNLPTFKLTYGGVELTEGEDNDYTYVTDVEKDSNGKYVAKDGYTVTFTGKNSYTGTRTETFHIGKPFDSEHVFVTMYGPAGTKTVNGENRLTYFGNNDPYFILTSDKTKADATTTLKAPSYNKGAYETNNDQVFEITSWSISDPTARHKVGSEVTVTFKAKEGGGTWYNPIDSNGVSNGVSYTYKVVPGTAGSDSNYGSLASGLWIYTKAAGGVPKIDDKKDFVTAATAAYGGVITFSDSDFKFKYTTEGMDPEIYIYYDPSSVDKACVTQSTSGGTPSIPEGVTYATSPVETKFNDSSLFTVSKGLISANDEVKAITMYPVSNGWIASPNIQVNYSFENALLSDAEFVFSPAEYTYTGAPAAVNYSVKLGGSTLTKDTDFVEDGYYAYPDSGTAKTAIDEAIADKTKIGEKLASFGDRSTTAPTKAGTYVLVIGEKSGGHYSGYNLAKFSITTATITAALEKPDTFSVTYGATKKAPEAGDLVVTGVDGKPLTWYKDEATAEGNDGYYIGEYDTTGYRPRTDAVVYIYGTGNYKGDAKGVPVQYKIVADISSGKTPDFATTNMELTNDHMVQSNCLELTLKNDGGLPFIGDTSKRFDLSALTLSYGEVTLPSSYLKTTIKGIGSSDSLTTVGKKKITVEAATGAPVPVTGSREYYYVEVFGDISTAEASLETTDGAKITGNKIPYTGSAIGLRSVLKFRGSTLSINDYTGGNGSYTEVKEYTMTLTGLEDEHYKGEATIDFSIVYDLANNMEILYKEDDESLVPLAGKSFAYTGSAIGPTIRGKIVMRVKNTEKTLTVGESGDCTLDFANDTYPGGNTATATISPISGKSINTQTVYFSIGGNDLEGNCTITLDPATCKYDGTAKTPKVTVYYKETTLLTQGSDYAVTYSNNINVSSASNQPKVTVTGINGRYLGSETLNFTINPKPLTDEDVDVDFPNVPFGGRDASGNLLPSVPTITVTSEGKTKTLQKGTDYDISYPGDVKEEEYFTKPANDTYTATITGKGNYTGTVTKQAKQLAGTLDSPSIVVDQDMTSVYNGRKVTFGEKGPVIKNGKSTLRYGTDYTIAVPDNIINAGEYKITITAVSGGDYYGTAGSSKEFTYTVTPRSVEDNAGAFVTTLYDPNNNNISVSEGMGFAFDSGNQIKPFVRLVDTGITGHDASVGDTWTDNPSLIENPMMKDFEVSYGDNKLAGKTSGSVTLTAKAGGNYTGTITKTFAIGQDISNATVTYDKYSAEYDGSQHNPAITVTCNGQTLTEGTAYESPIVYTWTGGSTSAPTEVGSYIPVIKGKRDGGYYGEKQGTAFRIIAKNKNGDIAITFNGPQGEVEAADYTCHYNTKQQKPSINVYDTSSGTRVAIPAENYTVTYGNNVNAGSGYVYVALKGNYTGTAQEIFFIEPSDISKMTLQFTEGENGKIKNVAESKFPYSPLFKLVGIDDNGEEFEVSYADSRLKQYLIVPDSSKVRKPGKGSFTVRGQDNLFGTTDAKEYEVYGRLSESNVSVKAPVYTGTKKDPEVTVTFAGETLVPGTDYSVRIIPYDQTATGGGNVVVTGLGYFSGNIYTKYGEAGDLSDQQLKGFSQQYVYSGSFVGPKESDLYVVDSDGNTVIPKGKLECTFTSSETDYSAGATVTITTKATFEDGSVKEGPSATYKIVQRDINSCDIKRLSSDNYTGRALTPPVSVSYARKVEEGEKVTGTDVIALRENRDYSLKYSDNVNPGTATITITGKGNFTGKKTFRFIIKVADMNNSVKAKKQTGGSVVVSWDPRPHVTGYRVLYNDGAAKTETTGTSVTLKDSISAGLYVQAFVKGSDGKVTYGNTKYVEVTN